MSKSAQVTAKGIANESGQSTLPESELLYLKKKKETEIRLRLDQFARELAQVKKDRGE